ncbi:PLP-dependent transferase [Eremomyces bilateralis CBS 781.70]|uniref:cystathionine gamma-synthase n=1 Tax=Eremomyces bilateralis CBS 781.70 TaxID=1392243 RepID=A0A6G1FXL6_9PEZI|nr:PLP-dependent transferase [Eremomyces bilateralis CBS 781.70]KAF1810577.1 PLP-dependent transferase [Eremomyces bilateralis CBS 781.70]
MASTMTEEDIGVGETIPPLTAHAVSVSLPTWRANVGYEEGQDWVLSKMQSGYPRFFVHKSIQALAAAIVLKYGLPGETAMLFPRSSCAARCIEFFNTQGVKLDSKELRIVDLVPTKEFIEQATAGKFILPRISAVIFPEEHFPTAKSFWQHTGEGVSSRRAEYAHSSFQNGLLISKTQAEESARLCRGPRRYQRRTSIERTGPENAVTGIPETQDPTQYVEERFGRNLEMAFADNAKTAIRRRIAGGLTEDVDLAEAMRREKEESSIQRMPGLSEDDVYLYPCGMNAIFQTFRSLAIAKGKQLKSIEYGFPYIDTLKILQKFGPGCLFYGFGSAEELDDLEQRLEKGEKYLALFCECPGNPLLKTPDLQRIRSLADKYGFYVVVDETVGNFLNVRVLPYADVVVSSLTKIFSGDSNVMGGSAILNPNGESYSEIKKVWNQDYEDNYWAEDALFMERNSRDFVSRIERVNTNADAINEVLLSSPKVKEVYYPKNGSTRELYDRIRTPNGGYGGLLSATFYSQSDAKTFFDNLDTAKGPSLGTNFTLSSPYVILAHFTELDWAASFGVDVDLVRVSVGLEPTDQLVATFQTALDAIKNDS